MQVSVIIPVYNAGPYLEQAVESALAQSEVAEIVLVEDGSPDDSLEVCERLAAIHDKIRLYRHLNGENRGAAASRNLGIQNASCEYIVFLDADDYFLPNRFSVTREVFEADPLLDGVYEAVGIHFEDSEAKELWQKRQISVLVITVWKRLFPEELLDAVVSGIHGMFAIQGLTVKRTLFEKTGLFDTYVNYHEDTVLMLKMIAVGRLAPGDIDHPVTNYRIHSRSRELSNRPFFDVYKYRSRAFKALWDWSRSLDDPDLRSKVGTSYLRFVMYVPQDPPIRIVRGIAARLRLMLLLIELPALARESHFWNLLLIHPRRWARRPR